MLKKQEKHIRRHKRVRAKVFGTGSVPRLCVFRSDKHIYAQVIDDEKGKTLVAASDQEIKISKNSKLKAPASAKATADKQSLEEKKDEEKKIIRTAKIAVAYEVGKLLAEKALKNKIKKVVFDRGGYKYHGRVKALAEGARKGELQF